MQIVTKKIPVQIKFESCSEDLINEASDLILDDSRETVEILRELADMLEEREQTLEAELTFPSLDSCCGKCQLEDEN